MIQIKRFVFNPFQENTYAVWDDTRECVIIDPGCQRPDEREKLVSFIESNALKPVYILLTHSHLDHIYGAGFCAGRFAVPVLMDERESRSIEEFNVDFCRIGIHCPDSFDFTAVKEGDIIRFGSTDVRVLSTPGHSPGGLCWWFEKDGILFSGDTLFRGCIGRTDNNCASLDDLLKSLRGTLMQLDSMISVYPGHGPDTTIGEERETNPFIYDE